MMRANSISLTAVISFSLDSGLGGRLDCADAFLATDLAMSWHLVATQSLQRVCMLGWPCFGGSSC